MKRFGVLLLILCAFAGPALAIADEPKPQASLPQLEDEVMCPVCGTLLGLSHSPAAERERVFIRKLIAEGKTDEEIKDALVAEYGGQVLALPENRGIDVWAYAVPGIGLVLGLIGVIAAIVVWRRRRPDRGNENPEAAPSPEEDDRLDEDMARFDL
ncbi:MAG TPA: cytochrome c-type biogenesis protein CcmH [Solirubrobacterales bacterium]|nr:cytochrome c-type biogenesis protein CcmH [Solirubrobacterales bacterium]